MARARSILRLALSAWKIVTHRPLWILQCRLGSPLDAPGEIWFSFFHVSRLSVEGLPLTAQRRIGLSGRTNVEKPGGCQSHFQSRNQSSKPN